ncbi:hypothetical protein D9Q98_008702 [Chlorella vulgaris]|uniref:Signal recognition particle subunit SRP72 n=1 Tax=Chlorella vulgaris TaxID=3077 RepID=A0A9D4YU77_CHLVU|nr:hypothetical protein D9Q98_008702 [Chlorella vulgaris]
MAEQVDAHFARLDAAVKNGQAKRGLKAADEILKLAPGDADALRCKVVLLIELGNFEEAMKLVTQPPLAASMAFEKAYCLYRRGKLKEALAALAAVPADQEVPRLQLEAQIQYRLGGNKEAIALYSQLYRSHSLESQEVQTNVVAAYVSGGRAGEVPAVMQAMKISAKDSFEIAFNVACGLVDAGQLRAAEEQLQLAVRVGEEALYDEDLAEADVAAELAPVTAQLAYVAERLGRQEEAAASYEAVLGLALEDATTASVATNNLYAALLSRASSSTSRKVAGEAVKKLDAFMERSGGVLRLKSALEPRLGPMQREALLASYATAALLANKVDVAKEAVRSIEKQLPEAAVTAMLQASLHWKEGKPREADAALAALAASGGSDAAEASLMRAQLAAARGDSVQALAHLSAAGDASWQAQPAVLATKLALLEGQGQGQADEVASTLASALQQWQSTPESAQRSGAVSWILKQLAALRLRQGELAQAAAHYSQLVGLDPEALEDPDVLSRCAQLAAVCDGSDAAVLRQRLQQQAPPAKLSAADLDALEHASIAVTSVQRKAADSAAAHGPAGAAPPQLAAGGDERKKRKRKRQPRYPKGFDPANPGPPPDPERWLPKWQRSDAKKLRKKLKSKDAAKGSQGAGKADDALDRSNVVDEPEAKPKAPARPPGGKGKKGKGRR